MCLFFSARGSSDDAIACVGAFCSPLPLLLPLLVPYFVAVVVLSLQSLSYFLVPVSLLQHLLPFATIAASDESVDQSVSQRETQKTHCILFLLPSVTKLQTCLSVSDVRRGKNNGEENKPPNQLCACE